MSDKFVFKANNNNTKEENKSQNNHSIASLSQEINYDANLSRYNSSCDLLKQNLINYSGIVESSIVDGYGLRFVLFVQGCPHHCEGCHNPTTHSFSANKTISVDEVFQNIMKNPLLKGVTFSGGEPLCQPKPLLELAKKISKTHLDLTIYTGYTFEELMKTHNSDIIELLSLTSLLVDGKFEKDKKDILLQFRGSSNQRLLDSKQSVMHNKAIPYVDKFAFEFEF